MLRYGGEGGDGERGQEYPKVVNALNALSRGQVLPGSTDLSRRVHLGGACRTAVQGDLAVVTVDMASDRYVEHR